jgi:DNA-binding LytR/AlgR family response regulator
VNVLLVDDEPLAREWLARLIGRMADARVCGEVGDGAEVAAKAREASADVVLLDIQIPGVSGLEVARVLGDTPFIFTTAHARYALEAFALDACDYLLKPIRPEPLTRAIERARRRLALRELWRAGEPLPQVSADRATLVVHERGVARILDARRVARFRASDKYTTFTLDGEEHLLRDSLDALAMRLLPLGFIRVHRAELIRKDAVVAFVSEPGGALLHLTSGDRVAVSRRSIAAAKRALGLT